MIRGHSSIRYPTLLLSPAKSKLILNFPKKKNIFIEYRKMENAVKSEKKSFPCSSLDYWWEKIMEITHQINKYYENNYIPNNGPIGLTTNMADPPTDLQAELKDAYDNYHSLKKRVDSQIAYQVEMSKARIKLKPKDKRSSDDYGQFLLITINPDPSKMKTADDIRRFASECRAFFRSYVFDVAEFVFEQRGTRNGDYHGIHCHGIVRRTDTPSKIKKEIKRRFIVSGICGNEQHVNVKTIDPNELQQTRNYLSGVKQGKNETEGREKREKQANDVHFRKEYGLSALYTEGEGKLLVPLAASR